MGALRGGEEIDGPNIVVIGRAVTYVAIWLWLVSVADAIKQRSAAKFVSALIAVAVFALAWWLIPFDGAFRLIAAFGVASLYLIANYFLLVAKSRKWQDVKLRGEMRRQAWIHVVLLTGAVFFLFPFVWLLTTSVKEDVEIYRIPPVWLPTQQELVNVDGKPRKLFTLISRVATSASRS